IPIRKPAPPESHRRVALFDAGWRWSWGRTRRGRGSRRRCGCGAADNVEAVDPEPARLRADVVRTGHRQRERVAALREAGDGEDHGLRLRWRGVGVGCPVEERVIDLDARPPGPLISIADDLQAGPREVEHRAGVLLGREHGPAAAVDRLAILEP